MSEENIEQVQNQNKPATETQQDQGTEEKPFKVFKDQSELDSFTDK